MSSWSHQGLCDSRKTVAIPVRVLCTTSSSMNNETTIWFAGFYEGEGSISNDISNNMRYRISISQNDKTPLELGKNIWGGSIRTRTRKSPASDKICFGHEWILYHKEATKFIEDISPFMKIPYKIKQIEKVKLRAIEGIERKFKCHYCEQEYANPSGRRRHEKTKHPDISGESRDTIELREHP